MEIYGKIIADLGVRQGTSQRDGSAWFCASYVLESYDNPQYPKRMTFDVFGQERIQAMALQQGEMVNVSFDIDAHEYQGKWFNSIRAYKAVRQAPAMPMQGQPQYAPQPQMQYAQPMQQAGMVAQPVQQMAPQQPQQQYAPQPQQPMQPPF